MISLPPIPYATGTIGLPLSDDSARQIAAIVLHDDANQHAALWGELLAADPFLLLWAALFQARSGQSQPQSVALVAEWLAPKAIALLDWSLDSSLTDELPHATSIAWRDLVQQVLVRTEAIVGDDPPPLIDPAFFQAALVATLQAIDSSPFAFPRDALPGWLQALPKEPPPHANPTASTNSQSPEIKRALRRWRSKTTGSGGMLPRLVQRLRRLHALESDYEQTLRHERLAAIRELAYGASHEINNPLANISTRAQSLLQEEHDPERRRKLATIHLQAMRAHEMIANLMHFAKPPKLQFAPVDLGECLALAIDELAEWSHSQGTVVHFTPPDEPCVAEGDRQQLLIALRALLRNALEALAAGGRIEVSISIAPANTSAAHAAPQAVVRIRDNGPGIDSEIMPRVFDPFFSGREAGRGLGFGLAWCWRIVDRHAGRIEVASELGHGAEFVIHLPLLGLREK